LDQKPYYRVVSSAIFTVGRAAVRTCNRLWPVRLHVRLAVALAGTGNDNTGNDYAELRGGGSGALKREKI